MIGSLKAEFEASFSNYVPQDGDDVRLMMLMRILKEIQVGRLIGDQMLEPHDLAAMMTSAVFVNPRTPQARKLLDAYKAWQNELRDLDEDPCDLDESEFCRVAVSVPRQFNHKVDGLADFFKVAPTIDGGKSYLAQVLVCLMWAHKIPEMIPNLYRPVGQE